MNYKKLLVALGLSLSLSVSWAQSSTYEAACPSKPVNRIVVFGDSVGRHYGLAESEGYVAKVSEFLQNLPYLNFSRNGATTSTVLDIFKTELYKVGANDLVIVEVGGNDELRGWVPPVTIKNLESIISKIYARGASVVLVAAPQKPKRRSDPLSDNPIYYEIADKFKPILVPGVFTRVLSDKSKRIDPIHPNSVGHYELAYGIVYSITTQCPNINIARQ